MQDAGLLRVVLHLASVLAGRNAIGATDTQVRGGPGHFIMAVHMSCVLGYGVMERIDAHAGVF